jgi:hypothetical protein
MSMGKILFKLKYTKDPYPTFQHEVSYQNLTKYLFRLIYNCVNSWLQYSYDHEHGLFVSYPTLQNLSHIHPWKIIVSYATWQNICIISTLAKYFSHIQACKIFISYPPLKNIFPYIQSCKIFFSNPPLQNICLISNLVKYLSHIQTCKLFVSYPTLLKYSHGNEHE